MLQSGRDTDRSSTYLNLPCTGVFSLLSSIFNPLISEIILSKTEAGAAVGLDVGRSVGAEVSGATGAEVAATAGEEVGASSSGKGQCRGSL